MVINKKSTGYPNLYSPLSKPQNSRNPYVRLSICQSMLFLRIAFDGLFAVGTYRYNLHRHTELFFQERQISVEFFGEFVFALHLCHIRLPAGQFHVHRFHAFDIERELIDFLTVDLICHTGFDCFE